MDDRTRRGDAADAGRGDREEDSGWGVTHTPGGDPGFEELIDAMMQWLGERAFDEMDPADPRNERFFEWWAKAQRDRQTPAERAETARLAAEFGKRMRAQWAAAALALRDESGDPEVDPPPLPSSTAAALDIAAARQAAPVMDLAVAAGAGRELWDEECTEWVRVPDGLAAGRHLALRVAGESMMPFLHAGDTLLVRVGAPPSRGNVVVARTADDGYVVKRVGRLLARSIELVSLNPDFEPVVVPRDDGSVLGTVVLHWCPHKVAT